MGGGGKGGGGPITVGYRYYWDIHSGLGRGPIDEVVEIRVDDKTAYSTKPQEITTTRAIYINKPKLFGGEDTGGEGGVVGRMEILMGEPDQLPSEALSNLLLGKENPEWGPYSHRRSFRKNSRKIKHNQEQKFHEVPSRLNTKEFIPGFRGIVSTFFSGMIAAYSAYPKKHSYRVRRTHKGWRDGTVWYPEKCKILLRNDKVKLPGLSKEQEEQARQIHAMNPAHILVECATNKSWGGKKDFDELDLESFKIAADTLFEEGFGLCFRYNRQGSIKEFIQQILEHIGGVQYDNIETGKLAIKLVRQDYNPDELPLFHYDNGVLSVQEDDTSSMDNNANQIIITYLDPVTNKENQAIANNLASIRSHGVIAKKVSYKGIPTFDLASRVAQRDLEMTASGLMRLKIRFDMRGSQLKPGDVFKISLPDRGINETILRVGKLENGNEGEIIITCLQDVFGLPSTNYSTVESDDIYIQPNYDAKPIEQVKLVEMPYHIFPLVLNEPELAYLKPTDCYITALAMKPTSLSQEFDMLVNAGTGFDEATFIESCMFTPGIVLTQNISPYETLISFDFDGDYIDLVNAYALLIDDEIIKIESVDLANKTISVGRGCADTIPQSHTESSIAWCYLFSSTYDKTKYVSNETLEVKLLNKTSQNIQDENDADVYKITTQQRQARPYPPGNVKVDGILGGDITNNNNFTISWAYRDRDIQADNLIAHTEDSTILGENVCYEIALIDNNKIVRKISTTDDSFTYPDVAKVDGESFNEVQLYSVKNNLRSLFHYSFQVKGALIAINHYSNNIQFDYGNDLLNRYDDNDMPGGNYIMLRSRADEHSVIYKDFNIEPSEHVRRFLLSYKYGTYARRNGLCSVDILLLQDNEVVKAFKGETFGNLDSSDWHTATIYNTISVGVNKVRFKINVKSDISNNALSFKDIELKIANV